MCEAGRRWQMHPVLPLQLPQTYHHTQACPVGRIEESLRKVCPSLPWLLLPSPVSPLELHTVQKPPTRITILLGWERDSLGPNKSKVQKKWVFNPLSRDKMVKSKKAALSPCFCHVKEKWVQIQWVPWMRSLWKPLSSSRSSTVVLPFHGFKCSTTVCSR